MPPALRCTGLTLALGGIDVLDNASLHLEAGQWTCLLGQSGSGKTTLLRFLCGLIPATDNAVELTASNGQTVHSQVAWMAQQDLLLPWLTTLDNLLLGQRLRRETADKTRAIESARHLLSQVGLNNVEDKFPHELSGGMRQRVALARTLMQQKPICLLDEPFSAVDAITRYKLQELAHELLNKHTVLLVTHDPMEAIRCGHRLHVLSPKQRNVLPALDVPGVPLRAMDNTHFASLHAQLLQALTES